MMGKLIIIIVEFMLIRPCRRLYGNWAHFQKWWNRNVHTLFAECTRLCIKCCTQHSSTASTFSQESVFYPLLIMILGSQLSFWNNPSHEFFFFNFCEQTWNFTFFDLQRSEVFQGKCSYAYVAVLPHLGHQINAVNSISKKINLLALNEIKTPLFCN